MHIATSAIKHTNDIDRRFYFLMCAEYWRDLYVGYPVFLSIARGMLPLASSKGVITPEESTYLLEKMRLEGRHHEEAGDRVITSSVIADFDLALTDNDASSVDAMASQLGSLEW
jgi:hypothetical protein